MEKIKKGVRLEHISKIYKDPKTGKDFYAVKDTSLEIKPVPSSHSLVLPVAERPLH